MSRYHIVTATASDSDMHDLDFDAECPDGPDEWCTEYQICREEHADVGTMIDHDGDWHGVHHERIYRDWYVPTNPARCWVVGHLELAEQAAEIIGEPGRYRVEHGVEDGEFLVLELAPEQVVP